MKPSWLPSLLLVPGILAGGCQDADGRTDVTLIGTEIPAWFSAGALNIFSESDSLFLNGRLLQRGIDYTYSRSRSGFDLSRVLRGPDDTLRVTYEAWPEWLQESYGRTPPAVSPNAISRPGPAPSGHRQQAPSLASDISISGAKSFQFSARSSGASSFSQTLDLEIEAVLVPGVEVTGVVSDRGYDPAYGPSNSRLSELDRLNLRLTSPVVSAQIGDMAVKSRFDAESVLGKRISGAAVTVQSGAWYAEALAARPRGRFESVRFFGREGVQGPYQIGRSSTASSIVPGSEQVWLDGRLLRRGADEDYTIDYPTGRITFSVRHSIDRRRRIEVDYEPRATDYRGELLAVGGGAVAGDSVLYLSVEVLREGDDKEEPLRGEFSENERDILASVGDSVSKAVRSGVTADTAGSYILVTESLPDSVYRYVGPDSGEFAVTFSFVGVGSGDYRFLGGGRYEFVGSGRADYRPVVILAAPQRTDLYSARVGWRHRTVGQAVLEVRQTTSDRNLFSNRDDGDNGGSLYSVSSSKEWSWHDRPNRVLFRGRYKEATFHARNRLYGADFQREYLLPDESVAAKANETFQRLEVDATPLPFLRLTPSFSYLVYTDRFRSRVGGVEAQVSPHDRFQFRIGWRGAAATHCSTSPETTADATVVSAAADLALKKQVHLAIDYERDDRKNDYSGSSQGTRYNRYAGHLKVLSEQFSFEQYVEDTLAGGWRQGLLRNRVSVQSRRAMGNLSGSAHLGYQWLNENQRRDESFLTRWHVEYHNARRKTHISAFYTLSEEARNALGITYLEVEAGQGGFIQQNGEYVPDPDGNFIRVDEILSDQSRVSRGEKSFHFSRDFSSFLIRFNSSVREELLETGQRRLSWLVPFLSDISQPYLAYARRYDLDLRLIPIRDGHGVNVILSEDREIRDISGEDKGRRDSRAEVSLRQVVRSTFFEQSLDVFDNHRDSYFSGGGRTDGFKLGLVVRQLITTQEVSTGVSYRRASSALDERSETYSLTVGARLRVTGQGEFRSSLELYRQVLANVDGEPSFQLTGNRPGDRGAVWSAGLRYGLKGGMRLNFSASGRHSNGRAARITGRGEMIVGF